MVLIKKRIFNEADIWDAMAQTERIAREMAFPASEILYLRLVTEEACTNAFEHYSSVQTLPYEVRWQIHPDRLEIMIRECGQLFSLPAGGTLNPQSLRGRGLPLILHLMDEVNVRQEETYIEFTMRKDRSCKGNE
ncbi:ATP-binding protein [Brevibacillus migulae]|uniref:ATP-binding protein n=1 Tax=Brevibacillus migulae TaxID=1644114 RepID=UPI00142F509C|nr:ATP-binding protein [Brevibacillus migulae]